MEHYYIPTENIEDWRRFLADPDKHWKDGYSAKMLATCWLSAGGFPTEVTAAFRASGVPLFQELQFLAGFPEYKVQLPGGCRPSQTDIMVLARGGRELMVVAVESKVEESFGKLVSHIAANQES